VYVNNVIKGKLLESETLQQQAANNTKEQFANSPDLTQEIMQAVKRVEQGSFKASKARKEAGGTNKNRPVLPGDSSKYRSVPDLGYPQGESNPCPLAENQIS
jgi:type I restriction enzyme, R subunit